jgi:hypothetical protein
MITTVTIIQKKTQQSINLLQYYKIFLFFNSTTVHHTILCVENLFGTTVINTVQLHCRQRYTKKTIAMNFLLVQAQNIKQLNDTIQIIHKDKG